MKSGNAQVTQNVSHMEEQLYVTVILLPLHPASLTHKKCKRNKIIHGMCPMGRKGQFIDRSEDVEYPVCMISVAVLVAVVYRDINYFFSSLLCFMMEGVFYFSKL